MTSTVSAVPDVVTALVTRAAGLQGAGGVLEFVTVTDGQGVTKDPGAYLMVGVDDPDLYTDTNSAESAQDWANATGGTRTEVGEVTCVALAWNGDGDQAKARDDAFAIVAAIQNLCRPSGRPGDLGVATVLWTSCPGSVRLLQLSDETGALAQIVFTVQFRARV